MPSRAHDDYLIPLVYDAAELSTAHSRLRTGQRGRQWGLGALNRGVVVMCVSAWEAYIEELVKEALGSFKPPGRGIHVWQSLNANARTQTGRFNNPNVENTRQIIRDTLGLEDVTVRWSWQNNTPDRARERLREAMRYRHEVAHGVNPRPKIHNQYSNRLPGFFRQLGHGTDRAVRSYLVDDLGVANPWPS